MLPSARRNLSHPRSTRLWKTRCACGQKQRVCFASQPPTAMSLPFDTCPKRTEFPHKPHFKYQLVFLPRCGVFPHQFQLWFTQPRPRSFKNRSEERVPSVPGHFRRQHSFSSPHSWLKHSSQMMWIIDFHKEHHHKLRCFEFYLGKLFLLWHALRQIRFWRHYHPPECFLPHHMPPSSSAAHLQARLLHEPDQRADADFNCSPEEISPNLGFCHSALPGDSAWIWTKSIRAV